MKIKTQQEVTRTITETQTVETEISPQEVFSDKFKELLEARFSISDLGVREEYYKSMAGLLDGAIHNFLPMVIRRKSVLVDRK